MESNNDKLSYRPISDGDSSAWYYSGGIDEMTSTGCFILKFNHVNTDAGLPMSVCQENHYINAILIVTESGTGDNLQKPAGGKSMETIKISAARMMISMGRPTLRKSANR